MKFKRLTLFVATFALMICGFLSTSSNNVSAHSWYWWAKKPRTVVLTRPRYIYEIQGTTPRYKSYEIRKKLLKAGTSIKIQHVASYDWIVTNRGYANGYFKKNQKFWVMNDSKRKWKETYQQYKKNHTAKNLIKRNHNKKTTASKDIADLKKVEKMTSKPALGGSIYGYFANIPKKGLMKFAFYHSYDPNGFKIEGDFVNLSNQTVNLDDYLNNYFTYQLTTSDLGDGNHYVKFHTNQTVGPYDHAHFTATSNGPKNAHDHNKLMMETSTNADVNIPFMGVTVPVFQDNQKAHLLGELIFRD